MSKLSEFLKEEGYEQHPIPWKIIKDPRVKAALRKMRVQKMIAKKRAEGKLRVY